MTIEQIREKASALVEVLDSFFYGSNGLVVIGEVDRAFDNAERALFAAFRRDDADENILNLADRHLRDSREAWKAGFLDKSLDGDCFLNAERFDDCIVDAFAEQEPEELGPFDAEAFDPYTNPTAGGGR